MLNDDHDCGLYYDSTWDCSKNCPGTIAAGGTCSLGHREHEPVWDLNYVGGEEEVPGVSLATEVAAEDDLQEVVLTIRPKAGHRAIDRSVTLTITNHNYVRAWRASTDGKKKGGKTKIHALSASTTVDIAANKQPYVWRFYVEGIHVGEVKFTVEVTPVGRSTPKRKAELTVYVVSLVETQGGVRKVINDKASAIKYEIVDGGAFNNRISWKETHKPSTSSDPTRLTGPNSMNNSIDVTYTNTATNGGTNNIQLPEDASNRRFESTVTATIHHEIIPPSPQPLPSSALTLTRKVRVAQDDYRGTAVAP